MTKPIPLEIVDVSSLAHKLFDRRNQMIVIWCCMMFFALQASWEGLTYIFGSLKEFDAVFREKYTANLLLVRTHAVASATALCLGLWAFWQETRRKRVHSTIGRIYALGVIVGGLTALPMAWMAEGGLSSRLAFFLQGSLWLITISYAVYYARAKSFKKHRKFMIRNYALTYSAVVSRLLLNGLQQAGLEFMEIYPVVSWTWVTGMVLGEWWIRSSQPQAASSH